MGSENCLLVIEALIGEPNEQSWANYQDLMMLTTSGGKERTKREYEQLLNSTGFEVERGNSHSVRLHHNLRSGSVIRRRIFLAMDTCVFAT